MRERREVYTFARIMATTKGRANVGTRPKDRNQIGSRELTCVRGGLPPSLKRSKAPPAKAERGFYVSPTDFAPTAQRQKFAEADPRVGNSLSSKRVLRTERSKALSIRSITR